MGKNQTSPSLSFFFTASLLGLLFFIPFAVPLLSTLLQLNSAFYCCLLFSGFCQMLYLTGLAGAYRFGWISISYPLARALPVLLVPLMTALTSYSRPLSNFEIVAMLLILLGVLLLPLHHYKSTKAGFNRQSFGYILLAALGTSGYSLSDDYALRQLTSHSDLNALSKGLFYVFVQGVSTCFWCLLVLIRHNRHNLLNNARQAWLTGAMMYATYGIVLIAISLVDNVSYIVALRQISIPLGVLLGAIVFKESVRISQWLATLIISIGIAGLTFTV